MRIGARTIRQAHVDHQPHAQVAQGIVVSDRRGSTDKQIVGDFRKIHAANVSQTQVPP